jgi:hypothetical protein
MDWTWYYRNNRCPIVILVGASGSGKTKFFKEFCHTYYSFPTKRVVCAPTIGLERNMVLVDTPGDIRSHNPEEYSWEGHGIFRMADIIVNFGDWHPREIVGITPNIQPHHLTWSGDNAETMNRILKKLQE